MKSAQDVVPSASHTVKPVKDVAPVESSASMLMPSSRRTHRRRGRLSSSRNVATADVVAAVGTQPPSAWLGLAAAPLVLTRGRRRRRRAAVVTTQPPSVLLEYTLRRRHSWSTLRVVVFRPPRGPLHSPCSTGVVLVPTKGRPCPWSRDKSTVSVVAAVRPPRETWHSPCRTGVDPGSTANPRCR